MIGSNGVEFDIVDMRPIPVAKADVQPHLLRRNIGQREIERVDVDLDAIEEVAERLILEHEGTLHRQVGRVDLQRRAPATTM